MTIFDLPSDLLYSGFGRCTTQDKLIWSRVTSSIVYSIAVVVREKFWSLPDLKSLHSMFGGSNIDVNRCPGCNRSMGKPTDSMLVKCICGANIMRTDIIMYGAALPAFSEEPDVI